MALLSMRTDIYWKKTGKKISIQGTDVVGFDKSKVECFNCHKMGHFVKECRAPRSQERGRSESFRQGSKEEEQAPKALMAIDGVGCDWSYMENKEENHALVADEEAHTEFALMAKYSSDNEVFDNSLCFKACLSQVEARLVEFKNQEIKFYEKIRGLEYKVESKTNRIESITNELETLKKEKEGLDSKLTCFKSATKDLDNLIGSQRSDKIKEDDTITDYTRPSHSVESNPNDLQNNSSSVFEIGESTGSILFKPEIKFVKPAYSPTVVKTMKLLGRLLLNMLKCTEKLQRVRTQVRVLRVPTVNRKFPTVNRKFPTGNSKVSTADLGNKKKAVKPLAYWIWKPRQNSADKGPNGNSGNSQNVINDKGYWDSGCSRHMTCNISYLSDYEPYDGG
nr:hypothetical protein [Tanacetum cinerariifolium]